VNVTINEGFPNIEVVINCPKKSDEICKIEMLLLMHDRQFFGVRDGQTHIIDRHDVLYFETVDKQCFIYTNTDVMVSSLKLYEIVEQDIAFIRSSKSQVINIKKIKSLCPDFGGRLEVDMDNGEKIIVSRQYAKKLKERLGLK